MYLLVQQTSNLTGVVSLPSSKSQSIRGMILSLLANGESTLINPLNSDDMLDAIKACSLLGAIVSIYDNKFIIRSSGLPLQTAVEEINTGNSGITTRFIMPILGLRQNPTKPIILDCGNQMRARPIKSLVDSLSLLGLKIQYLDKEGKLPVVISGQLQGGRVEIDGITSQYLSALLLSLPCASEKSEIIVKNLHERPYIDMTLNWLKELGIVYAHHKMGQSDVYLIPGKQQYQHFNKVISGDFSSASYLIIAAVMTLGRVELCGLDMNDKQGDKRLISILQAMGADIVITKSSLIIQGGRKLTGLTIDANDIPDLLPALAVIGTFADGKTEITNVEQARIKETDRIHSMTEGLTRLGAQVEEHVDGMTIYQSHLKGAQLQGFDDHRTVMALAIAGMKASGSTLIDDANAINKTFPTFISLMRSLGAQMEVTSDYSV